jgi:hypothetical protein
MAETLVDIGYRGVSVGKRARLVEVRPSTAFVELAAPMPVGSALTLVDDAGTAIAATVKRVREQVSGATTVAGMTVAPDLDDDEARTWWQARVELPEDDSTQRVPVIAVAAAAASAAVVAPVRVSTTAPMAAVAAPRDADTDVAGAAVAAALVAATRSSPATRPPPMAMAEDDHSRRTTVMDAVTADVLVEMTAGESGSRLVDDGKRTEMMATVDLAALGLDPASSGKLPGMPEPPASTRAQTDVDPDGDDPVDGNGDKPAERPSAAARRRKKRR